MAEVTKKTLRGKLVKATRLAIIAGSMTAFAAGVVGCSTNNSGNMDRGNSSTMGGSYRCKGMAACKGYSQVKQSKKKACSSKSKVRKARAAQKAS